MLTKKILAYLWGIVTIIPLYFSIRIFISSLITENPGSFVGSSIFYILLVIIGFISISMIKQNNDVEISKFWKSFRIVTIIVFVIQFLITVLGFFGLFFYGPSIFLTLIFPITLIMVFILAIKIIVSEKQIFGWLSGGVTGLIIGTFVAVIVSFDVGNFGELFIFPYSLIFNTGQASVYTFYIKGIIFNLIFFTLIGSLIGFIQSKRRDISSGMPKESRESKKHSQIGALFKIGFSVILLLFVENFVINSLIGNFITGYAELFLIILSILLGILAFVWILFRYKKDAFAGF